MKPVLDPLLVSAALAFAAYMDGLLTLPDIKMLAYWLIDHAVQWL